MAKLLKTGRVVVILSGRFAGKKAVVVKVDEEGSKDHKFANCLVVGIERYPRRVYRGMSEKTIQRRSSIKPFIKTINLSHIMPTRYNCDIKDLIPEEVSYASDKKEEEVKSIRKKLETTYLKQSDIKNEKSKQGCAYFFKRLRF